jgi:hypothetical protein
MASQASNTPQYRHRPIAEPFGSGIEDEARQDNDKESIAPKIEIMPGFIARFAALS